MTQGERRQKSPKEKPALLVHCFAFTLEEGDNPTLPPSDSVGLWRTTGGSGSHGASTHRPILPACPRPETREHTCPNTTYPNTNTNTKFRDPLLAHFVRPESTHAHCPNTTYLNIQSLKSRSREWCTLTHNLKFRYWSPQTQNLRPPPLAHV